MELDQHVLKYSGAETGHLKEGNQFDCLTACRMKMRAVKRYLTAGNVL
jgi:hypothetical protein